MEYIKGTPFFSSGKKIKSYPYCNKDVECEVLIIGGGIDGAIANYYLSEDRDCVLVDKGRLGFGCTACATALLEYQLDDFAEDLEDVLSEKEILDVYDFGLNAIKKISEFIDKNGNHCSYALRPSFLYSDKMLASKKIEKEYFFRKKNGYECELITKENNPFPFKVKRGLLCADGGCEFQPYLFTKQLVEKSKNQKKIFEHTKIERILSDNNGCRAETSYGNTITCKKIIIATGFNWELIGKTDLCERFSTYTIVTKPIENFTWYNKALIQDAGDPYHYLRLLPDHRIIFGGEDVPFKSFIDSAVAQKKYTALLNKLKELFPSAADKIEIDYSFYGCFGQTENNVGLAGKTQDENILWFFSCGANGIINAIATVDLLKDNLSGKENRYDNLFTPLRIL